MENNKVDEDAVERLQYKLQANHPPFQPAPHDSRWLISAGRISTEVKSQINPTRLWRNKWRPIQPQLSSWRQQDKHKVYLIQRDLKNLSMNMKQGNLPFCHCAINDPRSSVDATCRRIWAWRCPHRPYRPYWPVNEWMLQQFRCWRSVFGIGFYTLAYKITGILWKTTRNCWRFPFTNPV